MTVRGSVAATARLECVRCLAGFDLPLQVPLAVFAERAGSGRARDEEALERDDYMKFHDGRQLDLRDDAREVLLLELPMGPALPGGLPGAVSEVRRGPERGALRVPARVSRPRAV